MEEGWGRNMVIGTGNETVEEKNNRHIDEMLVDIEGWKNELIFAQNHNDKNYENYCNMMIQICENTLNQLKEFASQHFAKLVE